MRFERLALHDFRNLRRVELEPDPRFNVIVGANGQGKTNLLEAVHLLATLRPLRGQKNRELIRHEAESAVIEGWFDRGGVRREARVTVRPGAKRVELNGKGVRQLSDYFGTLNVVVFSPEDVGVFRGSPGDRRLFLDRMIFAAQPGYATEVAQYDEALRQRNATLRQERPDFGLLDAYDEQLARSGATIVRRRREQVGRLAEPFRRAFAEIFDEELRAELGCLERSRGDGRGEEAIDAESGGEGGGDGESGDGERGSGERAPEIADRLREQLRRGRSRDLAAGFTTTGPHRDDVRGELDGKPMRAFASQGQHRAFVLALKITEIRLLEAQFGHCPMLLLDDVSSELDSERNRKLFEFLAQVDGQVFITTTAPETLRLGRAVRTWNVVRGDVWRAEEAEPPRRPEGE